eukprot:5833473-Prymnesium_polylepis.1
MVFPLTTGRSICSAPRGISAISSRTQTRSTRGCPRALPASTSSSSPRRRAPTSLGAASRRLLKA